MNKAKLPSLPELTAIQSLLAEVMSINPLTVPPAPSRTVIVDPGLDFMPHDEVAPRHRVTVVSSSSHVIEPILALMTPPSKTSLVMPRIEIPAEVEVAELAPPFIEEPVIEEPVAEIVAEHASVVLRAEPVTEAVVKEPVDEETIADHVIEEPVAEIVVPEPTVVEEVVVQEPSVIEEPVVAEVDFAPVATDEAVIEVAVVEEVMSVVEPEPTAEVAPAATTTLANMLMDNPPASLPVRKPRQLLQPVTLSLPHAQSVVGDYFRTTINWHNTPPAPPPEIVVETVPEEVVFPPAELVPPAAATAVVPALSMSPNLMHRGVSEFFSLANWKNDPSYRLHPEMEVKVEDAPIPESPKSTHGHLILVETILSQFVWD